MADSFTAHFNFSDIRKKLEQIDKSADRATMWAIRECGRIVKQETRRRAPVYKGNAKAQVSIRSITNLRKSGFGGGRQIEGNGVVVVGALRDSIGSARTLKREGPAYVLRVGPRGPRVYKYAPKIEKQAAYMAHGFEAASTRFELSYRTAWERAMARGR